MKFYTLFRVLRGVFASVKLNFELILFILMINMNIREPFNCK